MKTKVFSALALTVLLGAGGVALASAGSPADINEAYEKPDVAITGIALEKASSVALAYVGQGRVTETEIEDEESYYEVEVTLPNGQEVDVQLDENFNVVGSETDDAHNED